MKTGWFWGVAMAFVVGAVATVTAATVARIFALFGAPIPTTLLAPAAYLLSLPFFRWVGNLLNRELSSEVESDFGASFKMGVSMGYYGALGTFGLGITSYALA